MREYQRRNQMPRQVSEVSIIPCRLDAVEDSRRILSVVPTDAEAVSVRSSCAELRMKALIDQGMSLAEIKDAKPLAALDPEWGQALIKGRAFVTIIYQSETGDWEIPAEITRWSP